MESLFEMPDGDTMRPMARIFDRSMPVARRHARMRHWIARTAQHDVAADPSRAGESGLSGLGSSSAGG